MSCQFKLSRFVVLAFPLLVLLGLIWGAQKTGRAQNNNGFFNRQVGGVSISADGVLARPTVEDKKVVRDLVKGMVPKVPAALGRPSELRMISLRGLEAACQEARANKTSLPDEIVYLSGMQRVQYVLIYPEQNDIVLAGPGEGWKFDENANVVGITTGMPVLQLDDLLVALRSVGAAKKEGLSCSIDPTPEGRLRLEQFMKRQKRFTAAALPGIQDALGPQTISLTGVPADSHLARVMVSADFQMKRLAMGLEEAPIAGLPSFLDLLQAKKSKVEDMMPRWWLACNYEPLAKSVDGLAWEIRGPGVKAMTEDDFVAVGGEVKGSGRKSQVAQQWADNMTKKYVELSAKAPIFAELRNVMDLCVVAALISKEDLCGQAGCQLPLLTAADSPMSFVSWNAPKTVATQCSVLQVGKEFVITASGGVQIESFEVVQKSQVSEQLPKTREKAAAPQANKTWYWN